MKPAVEHWFPCDVFPVMGECVPLSTMMLYKRHLSDVKYHLVMGERELAECGENDVVQGVYEGGLKTWECSVLLAEYLSNVSEEEMRGKRVLEVILFYSLLLVMGVISQRWGGIDTKMNG